MIVEHIDPATLEPFKNNARKHSKEQIAQIAQSIQVFGFNAPVLLDQKNGIIAGHGRVSAAIQLKLKTIPCIHLQHLTNAQKRAYILADNQIALNAEWDMGLLKDELDEILKDGFDISAIGFEKDELDEILKKTKVFLSDEDTAPEPQKDAISKTGDVWLLGEHRVMCGDSTNRENVEKLLSGASPFLMVTDPPYGVEYEADWRKKAGINRGGAFGKVKNDDRADWSEAWALFPGNIAYVWHAGKFAGVVQDSLEKNGFEIRSQIIWAKSNFAISRGDYHWQHEPCWYAVRGKGNWTGDRKQTTLWQIDKPMKSETGHSTQKPVECMRRPILNNSSTGDIVYDPFLGSGTTLIAAETENRVCYGMELNPAYVDVIVRRWQDMTGKQATHEKTKQVFKAEGSEGRDEGS